MVHTLFRREFAALPTPVRGVAAAGAERVDLIAEHTGLLTAVLEAHHRADTHLWPRLLDRAEEDLGPVVHVMEEQHERIEQLTAQAVVVLGEWREDPAAERRTAWPAPPCPAPGRPEMITARTSNSAASEGETGNDS